jgi:acetyltransferase
MPSHYLEPLFHPRSVALVGASERPQSLGRDVYENLLAAGFKGDLFAVNPKRTSVLGHPCHPSLDAIARTGARVDLAVVATPGAAVPVVLDDCAAAGVKHAVILAAGFGESGAEGKALEARVREQAKRLGIRLVGPNCLGIMRPGIGLNATFGRTPARPGPIALVSQSGAICTALVDWAWSAGMGFSSVISMGAAADLDVGELLDYLLYDHETHSILLYLEGIRDARSFLSGLRAAARSKPIVVVKVGRHLTGSKAALSHTGALVGSDAVFDAALRRSGVVRVQTYNELFSAARLLATDRVPQGPRLAIVTNGGGPGVLAADMAADRNVTLATFQPATIGKLNAIAPPNWSHANPADILGDATRERFVQAVEAVLADPEVDGVLTLFCPVSLIASKDLAEGLLPVIRKSGKPVLTSWLGEHDVHEGRNFIESAGMPAFTSPESGVIAFGTLAEYQRAQNLLMEVPPPLVRSIAPDLEEAEALLDACAAAGRTLFTEPEAKALLECFGIPTTHTLRATTLDEALAAAEKVGYPVAMKILSPDIAHKSDVHGVRLNVRDPLALREEFPALLAQVRAIRPDARIEGVAVQGMVVKRFGRELMVGIATDAVFGPVISVGAGGVAVELLKDNAIGFPPLSSRLAEEMIDRTRVARLLGAYRNIPAAKRDALVDVLLRLSDMVATLPWIAELDINPLVLDESGAIALDARVVVNPARRTVDRRYSHMAIHPYPVRYEQPATLKDGTALEVRPIRPEDAEIERIFVEELSDQSRYLRFFNPTQRLSAKMLARLTQVDYDRELALVAVHEDAGVRRMAGVARYVQLPDRVSCEFAVTIGDRWQGRGLGHLLMSRLVAAAREAGFAVMEGQILAVNEGMLKLARTLGFVLKTNRDDMSVVDARLDLAASTSGVPPAGA